MIASERVIYVYKNIADLSREKKEKKKEKEKKKQQWMEKINKPVRFLCSFCVSSYHLPPLPPFSLLKAVF